MHGVTAVRDIVVFLRGFGQIMLQESALTGALFLAGIWAHSPVMALGGIVGALAGVATARLGGFDRDAIARGWYGFNGALVGIALCFFHAPSPLGVALVIGGGALSSVVMRVMLRWSDSLPPYTAPFVLVTWAMLAIAHAADLTAATNTSAAGDGRDIASALRGIGQVMFQDSWIAGALFVTGLAVHSRHAAAWAVIGSAVGLVTARGLGYPDDLAAAGVYGFNGALVAIALTGGARVNAMAPLLGVVLSTVVIRGFELVEVPALTAPFVLSTWVVRAAARLRPTAG